MQSLTIFTAWNVGESILLRIILGFCLKITSQSSFLLAEWLTIHHEMPVLFERGFYFRVPFLLSIILESWLGSTHTGGNILLGAVKSTVTSAASCQKLKYPERNPSPVSLLYNIFSIVNIPQHFLRRSDTKTELFRRGSQKSHSKCFSWTLIWLGSFYNIFLTF